MPSDKVYCAPTTGVCPYCREQTLHTDTESVRPSRRTVICAQCDRISTIMPTGKRFPHDDPADAESPISRGLWLDLG